MRIARFAFAVALCLLLTACVQLWRPPADPAFSVAEELFDRGVAELASSRETTFFETLFREYPASPWSSRGRAVLDLVEESAAGVEEELDRRGQRAARIEEEVARLHSEEARLNAALAGLMEERDRLMAERGSRSAELDRLRADNARQFVELDQLRADNARLLGDLEQLKNLTIEMELKR